MTGRCTQNATLPPAPAPRQLRLLVAAKIHAPEARPTPRVGWALCRQTRRPRGPRLRTCPSKITRGAQDRSSRVARRPSSSAPSEGTGARAAAAVAAQARAGDKAAQGRRAGAAPGNTSPKRSAAPGRAEQSACRPAQAQLGPATAKATRQAWQGCRPPATAIAAEPPSSARAGRGVRPERHALQEQRCKPPSYHPSGQRRRLQGPLCPHRGMQCVVVGGQLGIR